MVLRSGLFRTHDTEMPSGMSDEYSRTSEWTRGVKSALSWCRDRVRRRWLQRSLEPQHVGSSASSDTKAGQTSKAPGRPAKMCKETAQGLGACGALLSCHGRQLMFCLVYEPCKKFPALPNAGVLASEVRCSVIEHDCVLTMLHN